MVEKLEKLGIPGRLVSLWHHHHSLEVLSYAAPQVRNTHASMEEAEGHDLWGI